jgi:phage replication initiation protein
MKAIIDWCTCTFAFQQGKITVGELLEDLSTITGRELVAEERRARPGYTDGLQIQAILEDDTGAKTQKVNFAVFAWGGESQRGRAMLDLSGECCGLVDDWELFRGFLEGLPEARLTRVDIAVDLLQGQYTVDDAVAWHGEGLFNVGGRNPSTRTDGDWLQRHEGRTLYIGKTKNGKGLRCYEKGKQLGDLDSKWVRFEVQFGNRDRILPFDMLTNPNEYFVAAYPALENIIEASAERIDTVQAQATISIATILKALKGSYGKWINTLADSGIDVTQLVDEVRIYAMPARLQSSVAAMGKLKESAVSAFEKWRAMRE